MSYIFSKNDWDYVDKLVEQGYSREDAMEARDVYLDSIAADFDGDEEFAEEEL